MFTAPTGRAVARPPPAPDRARVPGRMIDSHGRTIRDLRLSITDRCNFRCVYCMDPDVRFMDRAELLDPDALARMADEGARDVVVCPIGFVSDHMEVVFDLDTEAQARARALGLRMVRTATASNHPGYVEMVRELVAERLEGAARATVGDSPALPDACAPGCCPRTT